MTDGRYQGTVSSKIQKLQISVEVDLKHLNTWGDVLCSWIRRFSIMTMVILKLIYTFNAVVAKIPSGLSETDELILRFIWKCKELEQRKPFEKGQIYCKADVVLAQDRLRST